MSRRGIVPCLALLALAGCVGRLPPADTGPNAMAAARERARTDLSCEKSTAEVLGEKAPGTSVYDIDRREYRVQVLGCGKRTMYVVACNKFGQCSAMTEQAVIERLK